MCFTFIYKWLFTYGPTPRIHTYKRHTDKTINNRRRGIPVIMIRNQTLSLWTMGVTNSFVHAYSSSLALIR